MSQLTAVKIEAAETPLPESEQQNSAELLNDQTTPEGTTVIPLAEFVKDFGSGLLDAVSRQNPPVYDGVPDPNREAVMDALARDPFPAQREVVQAVTQLLVDANAPAAIINADMGTGKTLMAIATAAVLFSEGYQRMLVLSPPHLVYKWRREILLTLPQARVWILNGPDTLTKLLLLREQLRSSGLARTASDVPEFFILGRVRMRMGFHWRPAFATRKKHLRQEVEAGSGKNGAGFIVTKSFVSCPRCGEWVIEDGEPVEPAFFDQEKRHHCKACREPLWTLHRPNHKRQKNRRELLVSALCQLPTIGPKTADKLISLLGESVIEEMLADNIYEFINLMNEDGELLFNDRQAMRMERAMANVEFSFGQGGYQPTEFISRYLPNHFFDLMIIDEGHEYKNESSAQGQAMGTLANKVRKSLLLTGTLMGGYASDLFYLLWRIMPQPMLEDGFCYRRGSLGSAAMAFMRQHGVLKDICKQTESSHKTARGNKTQIRTVKAPGFGPLGVTRYVLPYTVFLKLKDVGHALPSYDELYVEIPMAPEQAEKYASLEFNLTTELKKSLAKGDTSLLGVVLNVLLAWPDTCFRPETVKHPRTRSLLAFVASVFDETDISPKEEELIQLCKEEKAKSRRVLVYTTYTGTRDTTARLKTLLTKAGLRVAVLRSTVDTSRREDWILEQVDCGVDCVITNPELVKTGLDLLEFPTIVFMQTGFNVYTLQQAARRSWRIGQQQPVKVIFLGYQDTAQTACLALMAKKISVSQSTSGELPDTGLDVLNQDGDSIEVALAKQLMK